MARRADTEEPGVIHGPTTVEVLPAHQDEARRFEELGPLHDAGGGWLVDESDHLWSRAEREPQSGYDPQRHAFVRVVPDGSVLRWYQRPPPTRPQTLAQREASIPDLGHEPEEARARLRTVERRDLTTTGGAGGNFVPPNVPGTIAEAFAEKARAHAVVAQALGLRPLPERGMQLQVPRFTTGATVVVQATQNADAGEGTPVEAQVTAPVATAAGYVDPSQQLLDRAEEPGMADLFLARELGRALGERIDVQLLNGAGSGGEVQGILGISGITSVTTTSTVGGVQLSQLWRTASETATAYGAPVDTVIAHPRRTAWYQATSFAATAPFAPVRYPGSLLVEANAVPVTLGGGAEIG